MKEKGGTGSSSILPTIKGGPVPFNQPPATTNKSPNPSNLITNNQRISKREVRLRRDVRMENMEDINGCDEDDIFCNGINGDGSARGDPYDNIIGNGDIATLKQAISPNISSSSNNNIFKDNGKDPTRSNQPSSISTTPIIHQSQQEINIINKYKNNGNLNEKKN